MPDSDTSLRFVVLRHEGIPEPHFDLMLESKPGGALVTWRSPVWPLVDQTPLTPLGEHRRDYLSYEGPISGNRGHVRRIAGGTFEWLIRGSQCTRIRIIEPEPADWSIRNAPSGRAIASRGAPRSR